MQDRPTDELDNILAGIKPEELDAFYKENGKYLANGKKAFYYYFKDVIEGKGVFLKDVYSFAGVSESWGSKIITMERHTKNRDLIIRLCVAGHFNLIEINRALKLYGMAPLYSKDKRDACIIVAINNKKFDLGWIDEMMEGKGLELLSGSSND